MFGSAASIIRSRPSESGRSRCRSHTYPPMSSGPGWSSTGTTRIPTSWITRSPCNSSRVPATCTESEESGASHSACPAHGVRWTSSEGRSRVSSRGSSPGPIPGTSSSSSNPNPKPRPLSKIGRTVGPKRCRTTSYGSSTPGGPSPRFKSRRFCTTRGTRRVSPRSRIATSSNSC